MLPRSIYLAFLNHSHSQSSSKIKLPPDSLSSQILSLSQASHTHLPFPMSPHLSSWLWVSVLQYLCFLLILYPLHHISGHLSVSHPQEIVLDLSTSHSSNWALHPCPAPGSRGNSFSFRMNVSASGSYSFCSPVHSGLQVRCRYLGTLVGHTETFRARSTSSPSRPLPPPSTTIPPPPRLCTLRSMRTVKTRPSRKGSRLSTNPWLNSWPGCCRRAVRPQADRLTKRPVRGCSSPPLPRPPPDPRPGPLPPGPPPPPGPGPGPGPAPEPPFPPDPAAIAADTAAARQPRLAAPWQPRRTDAPGEYGRGLGPDMLYGTARTEAPRAKEPRSVARGTEGRRGRRGLLYGTAGGERLWETGGRVGAVFATVSGRNARRRRLLRRRRAKRPNALCDAHRAAPGTHPLPGEKTYPSVRVHSTGRGFPSQTRFRAGRTKARGTKPRLRPPGGRHRKCRNPPTHHSPPRPGPAPPAARHLPAPPRTLGIAPLQ